MNLGALDAAFAQNFSEGRELGASVSVWREGREVVTLAGGTTAKGEGASPWSAETLVPIYSATKGPASAALLLLVERSGFDLGVPVSEIWPAFGQHGKAGVTVGEVLSHQAGVAALDVAVDVTDHAAVASALEEQVPNWQPGFGHGYHPRTFGFVVEELARRLDGAGRPLGVLWRELVGDPLDLDIWIGLPEPEHPRVATLYPGRAAKAGSEDAFYAAFSRSGSLTRRAFESPNGLHSVAEMNLPGTWSAGFPAFGGVASAEGLAKFYSILASGGAGVFSPQVLGWLMTPLAEGGDRVLLTETVFTAGMQRDPTDGAGRKLRSHYGRSVNAFGHPGAGGSHAFADPETGGGFAYVMNQMELSVLPGERVLRLIEALG
ncbi:serine hydrolase domain-containing protein [soil metagenome]